MAMAAEKQMFMEGFLNPYKIESSNLNSNKPVHKYVLTGFPTYYLVDEIKWFKEIN